MRTLRIVAWACAFCTLSPTASLWGQNDAIPAQDSLEDRRIKRVTRLATFIPGAGQIANRKYWKAPVVWGGMAYCISSIDYNLTQLDAARAHLIELENDPATDFNTLQSARSEEAFYRRNRDLSWFALVGVHALSILDAHVDANLLSFDVSENLALHLRPVPAPHTAAFLAPGLVIRWQRPGHKFTNFERSKRAHRAF
ncbi:MAG: DUF5683 domain-containing protein [Bacteroidota bacterium]|nr:DUF5683 domain-containing protein [Bacteroidota bacterium]